MSTEQDILKRLGIGPKKKKAKRKKKKGPKRTYKPKATKKKTKKKVQLKVRHWSPVAKKKYKPKLKKKKKKKASKKKAATKKKAPSKGILSVACPHCRAPAGKACKTPDGREYVSGWSSKYHSPRHKLTGVCSECHGQGGTHQVWRPQRGQRSFFVPEPRMCSRAKKKKKKKKKR
jgi:hypothetical protein